MGIMRFVKAHHELGCRRSFGESLFDEGVGEHDLGKLYGEVIFI